MDKQALLDSLLRIYRERISRDKLNGTEFFDDFLDYLSINGIKLVMKDKDNGKP